MGLGYVWRDPLSWADFLKMAAIMVPLLPRSRLMWSAVLRQRLHVGYHNFPSAICVFLELFTKQKQPYTVRRTLTLFPRTVLIKNDYSSADKLRVHTLWRKTLSIAEKKGECLFKYCFMPLYILFALLSAKPFSNFVFLLNFCNKFIYQNTQQQKYWLQTFLVGSCVTIKIRAQHS
jgi:hypothetical protein